MFLRWFSKTKSTSNVFPVHWAIRQSGDPNSLKNEKNQDIFFQNCSDFNFYIFFHYLTRSFTIQFKLMQNGLKVIYISSYFLMETVENCYIHFLSQKPPGIFFLHFVQILPGPGGKVRISKLLSFPLEEVKVKPFLFCNSFNSSTHKIWDILYLYI